MQGRFLTIDTVEDGAAVRDHVDHLEDKHEAKQKHKHQVKSRSSSSSRPSSPRRRSTSPSKRRKKVEDDDEDWQEKLSEDRKGKGRGSREEIADHIEQPQSYRKSTKPKEMSDLDIPRTVSFREDEMHQHRQKQNARRKIAMIRERLGKGINKAKSPLSQTNSLPATDDDLSSSEDERRGNRGDRSDTDTISLGVSDGGDDTIDSQSESGNRRRRGNGDNDDDDDDDNDQDEDDDDDDDDDNDIDDDDNNNGNADDDENMTEKEKEKISAQSGFYVPSFLRNWNDRRRKRRKEALKAERVEAMRKEGLIGMTPTARQYRRTPVFSGTIAPFAIMLEIPGFTSKWYVRYTPQGQEDVYRPNPTILDVGLAFSFACAVIGNAAILGRFTERLRPKKATIIAWCSFIIHDIINIVALISFGVIHAVDDGFTYSEAYWMTTASTVASLCCTTSLLFDYIRTKDFKNAGSGLTKKQSQLVIVIMAFLAYLSLSALIFALVMELAFLDAMYFSVETIATVGLGDITPLTVGAKIAFFFIAPGGIVLLGVTVAIARQTIVEEFEDAYKRRRRQYKEKLAERHKEREEHRQMRSDIRENLANGRKKKHGVVDEGKNSNGTDTTQNGVEPDSSTSSGFFGGDPLTRGFSRQSTFGSLFHSGPLARTWTLDHLSEYEAQQKEQKGKLWWAKSPFERLSNFIKKSEKDGEIADTEGKHILSQILREEKGPDPPKMVYDAITVPGNDPKELKEELSPESDSNGMSNEKIDGNGTSHKGLSRTNSIAGSFAATSRLHDFEETLIVQRKNIELKFEVYRKNLAKAQRNEFWLKLSLSALSFLCFWLVGAAIFSAIEDWSYFIGFYFVFVVFTSIGYGDYHPTTASGRAFFIVWALFGVGTLTVLFSVVSDAWGNVIKERKFRLGKKASKQSAVKVKMIKVVDGMLPSKVQERRRKRRMRKKQKEEERQKEIEEEIANSTDCIPNQPSSASTTGILLDSKSPAKSKMSDTYNSSIDGQNEEQDSSSGESKDNTEPNEKVNLHDAIQMHLDLTDTAMDFHRNAIKHMELIRENLTSTIHEVPEIIDKLRSLNKSDHKEKIPEEEREALLELAKNTQEPEVVRELEQTLLVHDFESTLHALIRSSTSFIETLRKRDEDLQEALEENKRLKKELGRDEEEAKTSASTEKEEDGVIHKDMAHADL